MNQIQEKKSPRLKFTAMVATGLAVILIFTIAPWNYIPVLVTENVTVIAVIEHGCVGESQYGIVKALNIRTFSQRELDLFESNH